MYLAPQWGIPPWAGTHYRDSFTLKLELSLTRAKENKLEILTEDNDFQNYSLSYANIAMAPSLSVTLSPALCSALSLTAAKLEA